MAAKNIPTISAILSGYQPSARAEALFLISVYGMQKNAARDRLLVQGDARKSAHLRTKIGRIETALGILNTWAEVL